MHAMVSSIAYGGQWNLNIYTQCNDFKISRDPVASVCHLVNWDSYFVEAQLMNFKILFVSQKN